MNPWICPRCKTVWAGWVARCDCKEARAVSAPTTAPIEFDTGTNTVECTCHLKKDISGHWCPVHDIQVTNTVYPAGAMR